MNPKFKFHRLLFPCLLFLLLSQSTSGQDYWPQFRGPNCSRLAAEDAILPTVLDENIYATPAIIGNVVYIRTNEHLYAYGK